MTSPNIPTLDTQAEIMTRYVEINNRLLTGIELSYIELDQINTGSAIIFARNNRELLVSELISTRSHSVISAGTAINATLACMGPVTVIDNTVTKTKLKQLDKQIRELPADTQLIISKSDIMQFPVHIVNRVNYLFVSNEFHVTEREFLFNHYLAHFITDYNLFANTYRIIQDNEFLVFKLNSPSDTPVTDQVFVYRPKSLCNIPPITITETAEQLPVPVVVDTDTADGVNITLEAVPSLESAVTQPVDTISDESAEPVVTTESDVVVTDADVQSSSAATTTTNKTWIEYLASFIW